MDADFISKLAKELENLPGETAHVEMFPLRARTSEALKTAPNFKLSGVMALLYQKENSVNIILTERQTYEGNHSGQMSFPGGKLEPSDKDSLDAALRETYEEIGIEQRQIQLIGRLSEVYIPVSNFLVHPYLGFLKSDPSYSLNEREVKSILEFDVRLLLDPSKRITTHIQAAKGVTLKNVPAFEIEQKIIWGATALMLNELRIVLERI